jgi:cytochrome c peroxidase
MVDLGRFDQTKNEADWGAFKTATLRNIARRAPYMHGGTFSSMKDALGHYIRGRESESPSGQGDSRAGFSEVR